MDEKLTDLILDEMKLLRAEIKVLNQSHTKLENKVYLISITLGVVSGEIKNVVNHLLGI